MRLRQYFKQRKMVFASVTEVTPEITALIELSRQDPFLGDIATKKKVTDMVIFYMEGKPCGFAIPRKDTDGRYRTGPIFVISGMRGMGIAGTFVKHYFADRRGRAYINPENTASLKLFGSIGFVPSDKTIRDGDEVLREYLKG
jgi:hypothetical protein